MSKDLTGGLTLLEIEALKKKHKVKSIHLVTVESEDGELYFWFKKPDMTTLSAVASIADKDPIKSAQVLFKNCLIKGDADYANDADVFPSVSQHLHKIMNQAKSKLEKF